MKGQIGYAGTALEFLRLNARFLKVLYRHYILEQMCWKVRF